MTPKPEMSSFVYCLLFATVAFIIASVLPIWDVKIDEGVHKGVHCRVTLHYGSFWEAATKQERPGNAPPPTTLLGFVLDHRENLVRLLVVPSGAILIGLFAYWARRT